MQFSSADVQRLGQVVKNPFSDPGLLMEFAGSRARRSLGFASQPFDDAHPRLQGCGLKMVECVENFGTTVSDRGRLPATE